MPVILTETTWAPPLKLRAARGAVTSLILLAILTIVWGAALVQEDSTGWFGVIAGLVLLAACINERFKLR